VPSIAVLGYLLIGYLVAFLFLCFFIFMLFLVYYIKICLLLIHLVIFFNDIKYITLLKFIYRFIYQFLWIKLQDLSLEV